MLEHGDSPQEFLEHTKLEMFQDQVFCFTVKGSVIVLPQGSTPVDFAYAVHTDIGDSCVGAKVNGRQAPLRTQLCTGDEVEILRSDVQEPSPAWESMVVTGKARSAIRRAIKKKEKKSQIDLGREILRHHFRTEGRRVGDRILERALGPLRKESLDDLFWSVGRSELSAWQVLKSVYPRAVSKEAPKSKGGFLQPAPSADKTCATGISVRGSAEAVALHVDPKTLPLPGERIVGIITKGKGITVYPIDSPDLQAFDDHAERWVDLSWEENNRQAFFRSRIILHLLHEVGALASVAALIADYGCNIEMLQITARDSDFLTLQIELQVHDLKHLNLLLTALGGLSVVHQAQRMRG